jgi:hypothetical protein
MSKIKRQPVNHGKHADPSPALRRENAGPEVPPRRRRKTLAGTNEMRLGGPPAGERPANADHPPWTDAGDYLRAAASDEAPARFGTPSGPVDDYARRVWHRAFSLAVRRRFEPSSPLAEISRSVATAVQVHDSAGLPAIDAEMLVRAELGEVVPVDELDQTVRVGVHLLVFASLVDEMALGDGELDDLVTEAERLAVA